MVKSNKKIFALICAMLITMLTFFGVLPITAQAQEEAALRIDFSDETLFETSGSVTEENGVTLAAQAAVSSKETFTDFIAYVTVSVPQDGSVTVGFGGDKSIVFSMDGIASSLAKTEDGNEFAFADLADNGIIMLYVLGSRVEVGVTAKDGADNDLHTPKAVYDLQESAAGKVTVTAGDKSVSVKRLDIYGLGASIDAPNGDYDENGWKVPEKPTLGSESIGGEDENTGRPAAWVWVVSAVGAAAVAALLTVAIVLTVKRRKSK